MTKVYISKETESPGHTPVYVRGADEDDDEAVELDKRLDLANHSPDGYGYGYRGSGSAQLALAILSDMYDDDTATEYYRQFQRDKIALMPGDDRFRMTGDEIQAWMEEVAGEQ